MAGKNKNHQVSGSSLTQLSASQGSVVSQLVQCLNWLAEY